MAAPDTNSLPPLVPWQEIQKRLQRVFPQGTHNRTYCVREMAAKAVFTMLYVGAIEGRNAWVRPDQVMRMSNRQTANDAAVARQKWAIWSLKKKVHIRGRWYQDNSRESLRDETFRDGLILAGAVSVRPGLPTTSSKPRYSLTPSFAALFEPTLQGQTLDRAITEWQREFLSITALTRIRLTQGGAVAGTDEIAVEFPNGDRRRLAPGPSSHITKAVIEQFAPRFLEQAAVILLSESRSKIIASDDGLARSIGLKIESDKELPDIILADLKHGIVVFVEIVATDGAVTPRRKAALLDLVREAKFPESQVAFVTAYLGRDHPAFRRTIAGLAWGSLVWFVSEPENILLMHENTAAQLPLYKLLHVRGDASHSE